MPEHKIVKQGISHVPEGRRMFSNLTVLENLKMGAYTRKDKQEINNSLEMVYERFPRLKERTRQLAGTLSGGEQQMLAMGRALMANPRILLLDEPSMGLSPLLVSEIFDIIQEINKQGVTILLVEQNAKKALSIANRAYVLETGRIVKENDAQALFSANKGETIMSNTVITIARQYGSGGRTVGKMLAKRLDIPCYDREIISLASEESGIHPTLFQDEKKKHGSLRAFLTGGFKNASPLSPESAGFTKDDNLFRYQAKIIRQLAEESSCVIIGRCADHILADVPGVVRVFVHAPEDFCLQEAMKVNSLSVSDVQKLIAQTDEYRAHYYKYYTGQEWKNAQNYDLSLDSSRLGFDGTVEAILSYIEVRKKFDKTM